MKRFMAVIIPVFIILPVFLSAQMETIIISDPVFRSRSRSSVKFNHINHMSIEGVSCNDCHHRYQNGRNVLDPAELAEGSSGISCSSCHSDSSRLKDAYHRLCIGCHQSMISKKRAAGPRLCGDCHK